MVLGSDVVTGSNRASLQVRMRDGVIVAVPPTLSAITTYVLLEQEDWFEKEMVFLRRFLRPGMTAVDIGANLGVYSLRMARLLGPNGRVAAYEPGGEARALLELSRDLNGLQNLQIFGAALSDSARDGNLAFATSSELRTLASEGTGERVSITTLDIEDVSQGWGSPDFIKIDAEGEEQRILDGGADFFVRHSPLVMFEVKVGDAHNARLRGVFPEIGYRLFRQLGDAPILVPDDPGQALDPYELNLFAAKPDRARALSEQHLLVETVSDWIPSATARQNSAAAWRSQDFVVSMNLPAGFGADADVDYQNALAAYAIWREQGQPVATRVAALAFALHTLREVCGRKPTAERLSTFARVAWQWGARGESVAALQRLFPILQEAIRIREPFWPASSRFDHLAPGSQPAVWFTASAAEQFERTVSFSTVFSGASMVLPWLCNQPFASSEMERRRVLIAARDGQQPKVPARLLSPALDHLNADMWRSGLIPGTRLE